MSNKLKGIIFTLIGGSLWGFSGVCGQYLFQIKNIDPQWLSAWRLFASGLMILIFLIPKEKKNVFNVFSKDIIVPMLIFSFVSVMGCQYSYFMAIYYSNSANLAFKYGTNSSFRSDLSAKSIVVLTNPIVSPTS